MEFSPREIKFTSSMISCPFTAHCSLITVHSSLLVYHAKSHLDDAGIKVMGAILNEIKNNTGYYGYKGYKR